MTIIYKGNLISLHPKTKEIWNKSYNSSTKCHHICCSDS